MSDGMETLDRRQLLVAGGGVALTGLASAPADAAETAARVRPTARSGRGLPFGQGWLFHRGELAGESPTLADGDWRSVDLPHDWSIEDVPGGKAPRQLGPFDKTAIGRTATGFTLGGEGWYRKHFRVDGHPADARIELLFEGSYAETDVWLNGRPVGSSVAGYAPFAVDLTPALDRGGGNVLAVRVRNLGRNSRWYSGSGLYRPVTMDVLPASARLARWGTGAITRRITGGAAEIEVTTAVEGAVPGLQLVTRLRDRNGRVVAQATAAAATQVRQTLRVRGARLWSPDTPALYALETELRRGGDVLDATVQDFGVRIVSFDPARGMTVNGRPAKLRGGCIHHDNGLLGACAYADADERRVRLLKQRGYNAIRSSHNPSSASLRAACDRQGMWVIEEAFDAWHEGKEPQDFATRFASHWQDVLRPMVLAARNSPSVLMWSIGNEIPSRASDQGIRWQWTLADAVKRIDDSRPVTAGLNGVLGAPVIANPQTARPGRGGLVDNASTVFLDVPGYNYRLEDIAREAQEHPERVVYASETFARDMVDYRRLADTMPSFLGEFVWTALDYLGEAGIGATSLIKKDGPPFYIPYWPWVGAWCGDLDLIGEQKAPSLARDVVWGISPLEMVVARPHAADKAEFVANWGWPDELASWSWAGSEGKPLAVRVYTAGDRVELRLNGRPAGSARVGADDRMRVELSVPYQPGRLEAIAFAGNREIGRRTLTTAGPAIALRIRPEPRRAGTGRDRLSFVRIDVVDAAGRVLPDEQREVRLEVAGPAQLVAFGSASPLAAGSLQGSSTTTFRGHALAILRDRGTPGTVDVVARSAGLTDARAAVRL